MKKFINEGAIDRMARFLVGELLFIGGFFWLGGVWQYIALALSIILLITAISGFCLLYPVFGTKTCSDDCETNSKTKPIITSIFIVLIVVIAAVGSYYSNFFSKKFFLDDYNTMNNNYKQTLFTTGQNDRESALANYEKLTGTLSQFSSKYSSYHPYVIKSDHDFNADVAKAVGIIDGIKDNVTTGDLYEAHLTLEEVRPIFQDILKRNGFSMLAVALVDFHDVMETVIEAADKGNLEEIHTAYQVANEKLQAIEAVENDAEIQAIRQALDAVEQQAQEGTTEGLSDKAATLKSYFVKVYLKRG